MTDTADREAAHGGRGVQAPEIDLTVVVPSYNTRDLMEQTLRTVLEASAGLQVEVIVVDNASRDGSAEMVEQNFPEIELIRNERNLGFAAANNIAFRRSRGRYVLLLNSDTIVRPDTLGCLVQFLDDHPEAAAAGCKILNPDGTLQLESRRSFPTPMAAFYKLSGLSRLFPDSRRFGRYNLTYLDEEQVSQVDALSGSCMMVRRRVIDEVGPLDEDYFMYGEDIDWCYRMQQAGWKIYYVPDTEIIHFRGESGKKVELRTQYRKNEAMAIFVRKHLKQRYPFSPLLLLNLGIILYGLFSFLGPLARRLTVPAIDAMLVLLGLKLGLAVRYHPDAMPLIGDLEAIANRLALDVNPTRWLTPPPYSDIEWQVLHVLPTCIWLASFFLVGLYDRHRLSAAWAVAGVALGFAVIVTSVFFFKAYNFSRLAVGGAWVFNTILVAGWRIVWLRLLRSRHLREGRRTLVVGVDESARQLLDYLARTNCLDCELIGVLGPDRDSAGRVLAGIQIIGSIDQLEELVAEYSVDEVIFTSATISHSLKPLGGRRMRSVHVRMVPASFPSLVEEIEPQSMNDLPLVEIRSRR